jgi:hypothetical protein
VADIKGYRQLSDEEVALVNKIKDEGIKLETLIDEVKARQAVITETFGTPDAEVYRWSAIAKTHFQQGLMALTRAVTKPETF